jgi:putative salt-induced outer membrane protein|tara:strand:- start:20848 stop:21579 length:732 start_codon:yes stop_codon:yes gene_type:complete
MIKIILAITIFAISQPILAQNREASVAIGYLATGGNTNNQSSSANFDILWRGSPWQHALSGSTISASSENVNTAEAHALEWQSNYSNQNSESYAFTVVSWDKDKFSAYDSQIRQSFGYGRKIINTTHHQLNSEIGIGARQAKTREMIFGAGAIVVPKIKQDEAILRLSGSYNWLVSETTELQQSIALESGSNNTYFEAITNLNVNIINNIGLILSYTIKNNSDVPISRKKTDTYTAISLEYAF